MLFLSILACWFLTKKVFDYISPNSMNNLYIKTCLHIYEIYENSVVKLKYIKSCFNKNNKIEPIQCIKSGVSTNYTILEFQQIKNGWWNWYDLCLLNIPNETYKCEKYRYNVVRLCPKKIYSDQHISSNVEFMDVRIVYKENIYKINFGERNFYIVDNILFDSIFIRWCMYEYHKIQMTTEDSYECVILDNNVKSISVKNNSHIVINIHDYTVSTNHQI